jgi:outer membrane receptor protein involved in Fe transport
MSRAWRGALLRAPVLIAGIQIVFLGGALAQAQLYTFNIARETLSTALRDYARVCGQQIIFTDELVSGRMAPSLRGAYTADEALSRLLADTGLVVEHSASGAVMIRRGSHAALERTDTDNLESTTEVVVVTGSRIVDKGYPAPTPVTSMTTEDLLRDVPESIPAALSELPQFTMSAGANVANSQAGTPNAGNYLNLRGLGAIESLILMDGSRLPATSYAGTVDANIIPQAFVSRVDVITGGASASYGSDAVSGVVNFIIRKNFNGLKGSIQSGISRFGDDAQLKLSLAGGMPLFGGAGHVEASYDHFQQPGIPCPRRTPTDCDRPNAFGYALTGTGKKGTGAYVLNYPVSFNNATFGTLITSAGDAGGRTVPFAYNNDQFTTTGIMSFDPGAPTNKSNYNIGGQGAWTFGTTLTAAAVTDQGYARFDYDLTPHVQAYAAAVYSQAKNSYITVADGSQVNAFQIFQDNAFLPTAVAAEMKAQSVAYFVGSRFEADQPAKLVNTITRALIGQAGLRGTAFGGSWNWSADYSHGDARLSTQQFGNFRYVNWYPALDAVRDPGSGAIVCRIALTNPGLKPGCVPWNPFGDGSPSAAAYDYINGTMKFWVENRQDNISMQFSGGLFELPAGEVNMATGLEYREQELDQTSNNDPSRFIDQTGFCHAVDAGGMPTGAPVTSAQCNAFTPPPGIVRSTTSPSVLTFSTSNVGASAGSETIAEGFVELAVPLVNDLPLIGELNTDIAYRFAQYSTSGSAHTWKIGFNWRPLEDLRVRATLSRDFRAPTLYELFAGQSATFSQFNDAIHSLQNLYLVTLSGGNPNLRPEIGNTSTVGLVWSPPYVQDFNASLDYYTIRITDQISRITSATENQLCEDSGGTDPLCGLIVRPTPFTDHSPASFPYNITTVPYNQDSVSQTGFDLDMSYRLELDRLSDGMDASLAFRFVGTYIPSILSYTGIGGRVLQGAGASNSPKIKFNFNGNFIEGPLNLGARIRFLGPVYYTHDPAVFYAYNGGLQASSEAYLDLNASYDFVADGHGLTAYGGIANIFNKFVFVPGTGEPFEYYPTNQNLYDVVGRYFTFGLRFRY